MVLTNYTRHVATQGAEQTGHRRIAVGRGLRFVRGAPAILVAIYLLFSGAGVSNAAPFRQWAEGLTQQINSEFEFPGTIYAGTDTTNGITGGYADDWPSNIQFRVLTAAAAVEPKTYTTQMTDFATTLKNHYLVYYNSVYGYNAVPYSRGDRFYDDNGGNLLGLMEMYKLNQSQTTLSTAENVMAFELSGEDSVQGGGIYQNENNRAKKVASATIQTVMGGLLLYQATGQPQYLEDAHRLYNWMTNTLEAPNGLFYMNIADDGTINKVEMSSNAGYGIIANLLFYNVTHNQTDLNSAIKMATVAKNQWIGGSGQLHRQGKWGFKLMDAFLQLYQQTGDTQWLKIVENAMIYVHDNVRDANGHYATKWGSPVTSPLSTWNLIDQASVARVYWRLAADAPAPGSLALMAMAGILLFVRPRRTARCVENR